MNIGNDCSVQEVKVLRALSEIVFKKDSFSTGSIAALDLSERSGIDSIHLTCKILKKLYSRELLEILDSGNQDNRNVWFDIKPHDSVIEYFLSDFTQSDQQIDPGQFSGLQKTVLVYIFSSIKNNDNDVSEKLTARRIAVDTMSNIHSVRKVIQRLENKKIINRLKHINGRHGGTIYSINPSLKNKLRNIGAFSNGGATAPRELTSIKLGFIYFIRQESAEGYIKIGFSAKHPTHRLKALQTASPQKLHLLGFVSGQRDEEKKLHTRFKDLRQDGEWFLPASELLNYINGLSLMS